MSGIDSVIRKQPDTIQDFRIEKTDGKEIVPNSCLTNNEIINRSNQKKVNRDYIDVHVPDKDVDLAMQFMKEITTTHDKVNKEHGLYVRIEKFTGCSAVQRLFFWSEVVFARCQVK
ncbi:hypothetical protein BH11BAC1_BH11BAC1_22640 [soil metagenome]